MRNRVRLYATLLAVILLICTLTACKGGIRGDEAKAFIGEFFEAIVAEDYEKAATFLHPDRPADLEEFFVRMENRGNIDFQSGISIEQYTGFSSSYYDSTVGGSTYELTMLTKVGSTDIQFTIEIVSNENGYGIYNLDIAG